MIDQKMIEKLERLDDATILRRLPDSERSFFEYGFQRGYNRALKDLWHPASETPDLDRRILYEYKANGEINPPTHIREATYEKVRWKECGYKPINPERIITRWLYIDDLIKEGGNQ